MERKAVETLLKMVKWRRRRTSAEEEDEDRLMMAAVMVPPMVGTRQLMVVEVAMVLWLMAMVGIQPRKRSTFPYSLNGANQKRYIERTRSNEYLSSTYSFIK